MRGLGCTLLFLTFAIVVVFPPAAVVVVPLFTLIWVVSYFKHEASQ